MEEPGRYTTTNLYAGAALMASGAQFIGTRPAAGGRLAFVFLDPAGTLADTERAYRAGRMAPVQPRAVIDGLFVLRDALAKAKR